MLYCPSHACFVHHLSRVSAGLLGHAAHAESAVDLLCEKLVQIPQRQAGSVSLAAVQSLLA